MNNFDCKFPTCESLGFYPIVDSAAWVKRLAKLNVKSIQLRIKDGSLDHVESEIIKSNEIARQHNIQFFVNDYWQLAIKHQTYGVHLGQEDLNLADILAIHNAGLRLGISTHSSTEIVRASGFQPSYLAFGPIFPTTSKTMQVSPRGIEQLRYWRALLSCPMTAIGGINLENVNEVLSTNIESVAVISAVTQSDNVEETVKQFLKYFS